MNPSPQELFELEREGVDPSFQGWDLDDFEAELSLETGERLYLCDDQGKLQAFVLFRVTWDEAWIMHLAVRDKRKGWGSKVMQTFLDSLVPRKVKRVGLELRSANEGAMKLYEKFSFREIGRRANYYANGDDAIVMIREE